MNSDEPMRKRGTSRLVVGLPHGVERGISARIETADGDVIVIREETLGALVQAYMDVFTHPTMNAVELLAATVVGEAGAAEEFHLVPGDTIENVLRRQLVPAVAAAPAASANPSASAASAESWVDDTTLLQRNAVHKAASDGPSAEMSSGGLKTQAMSQLDQAQPGGHAGWQTRDDGPVFGDSPTHHSAPIRRPPSNDELGTISDNDAEPDDRE